MIELVFTCYKIFLSLLTNRVMVVNALADRIKNLIGHLPYLAVPRDVRHIRVHVFWSRVIG